MRLAFPERAFAVIIPSRMTIADRITERLEALGITANAASLKAGLPRDAVRDILNGKSRNPRADTIAALSAALECDPAYLIGVDQSANDGPNETTQLLPIRYETAAGTWRAVDEVRDEPYGFEQAARIRAYDHYPQWLERVRGDSMDRLIPDGGLVHVVDVVALRYIPRHNDLVVVVRRRAQGAFYERTIKQVSMGPRGIELWPRSHNPKWNSPLSITDGVDDEETTIEIVGLVIRGYISFVAD